MCLMAGMIIFIDFPTQVKYLYKGHAVRHLQYRYSTWHGHPSVSRGEWHVCMFTHIRMLKANAAVSSGTKWSYK